MTSIIGKIMVASFLSLFLITSASAWHCRIHNARGQAWDVWGSTRTIAAERAMKYCVRNSDYASNCVINSCWR